MKQNSKNIADTALDYVADTVKEAEVEIEQVFQPIRKTVFARFPSLFLLLVTFGVSAIIFSFERIMTEFVFLYERPWLILILGVVTLLATGTLYKKLG